MKSINSIDSLEELKPEAGHPIDFLWRNIKDLPYFRAILRAVEARFYQDFEFESQTLDLGCGDGHFAANSYPDRPFVGIDINYPLVKEARTFHGHNNQVVCLGDMLPFGDHSFKRVVSNSVLEHIEQLDPVIEEVSRIIKPRGDFIFCVPNQNFLSNLSVSNFLDKIGLTRLADAYRSFFNKISRHYHCDSPEIWKERLNHFGFEIEEWWHYFSPDALRVLEWGHYFGLPSWISHVLFKRWILVPQKWNLWITQAIVQKYYDEDPRHPKGSYTFYVTRKL